MIAARGEKKDDDLVQRVTVAAVRRWLSGSGFQVLREKRQVSGFFAQVPRLLRQFLERNRFTQSVIYSNLEYLLVKPESSSRQTASPTREKNSWVQV